MFTRIHFSISPLSYHLCYKSWNFSNGLHFYSNWEKNVWINASIKLNLLLDEGKISPLENVSPFIGDNSKHCVDIKNVSFVSGSVCVQISPPDDENTLRGNQWNEIISKECSSQRYDGGRYFDQHLGLASSRHWGLASVRHLRLKSVDTHFSWLESVRHWFYRIGKCLTLNKYSNLMLYLEHVPQLRFKPEIY